MTTLITLIIVTCLVAANGLHTPRYYQYPTGLAPLTSTLDFTIMNAASVIPETNKDRVLEAYKFSETFLGFIFDSNGHLTKVLARARGGANFTNDWGELMPAGNGTQFFEQIPVNNDNSVFMFKFFDFENFGMSSANKKIPKDYKCLSLLGDLVTNKTAEEWCREIPRCMGFVEGECLVSSASRNQPLVATTNKVYHQKRRVHRHVDGIKDNIVLFLSLYGTALVALVAIPSVLEVIIGKVTSQGTLTTKSSVRDIY